MYAGARGSVGVGQARHQRSGVEHMLLLLRDGFGRAIIAPKVTSLHHPSLFLPPRLLSMYGEVPSHGNMGKPQFV